MNEQQLRDAIGEVRAGLVSRRAFVRRMIGLGLTAPFAAMLLKSAGVAAPGASSSTSRTSAAAAGR